MALHGRQSRRDSRRRAKPFQLELFIHVAAETGVRTLAACLPKTWAGCMTRLGLSFGRGEGRRILLVLAAAHVLATADRSMAAVFGPLLSREVGLDGPLALGDPAPQARIIWPAPPRSPLMKTSPLATLNA